MIRVNIIISRFYDAFTSVFSTQPEKFNNSSNQDFMNLVQVISLDKDVLINKKKSQAITKTWFSIHHSSK